MWPSTRSQRPSTELLKNCDRNISTGHCDHTAGFRTESAKTCATDKFHKNPAKLEASSAWSRTSDSDDKEKNRLDRSENCDKTSNHKHVDNVCVERRDQAHGALWLVHHWSVVHKQADGFGRHAADCGRGVFQQLDEGCRSKERQCKVQNTFNTSRKLKDGNIQINLTRAAQIRHVALVIDWPSWKGRKIKAVVPLVTYAEDVGSNGQVTHAARSNIYSSHSARDQAAGGAECVERNQRNRKQQACGVRGSAALGGVVQSIKITSAVVP